MWHCPHYCFLCTKENRDCKIHVRRLARMNWSGDSNSCLDDSCDSCETAVLHLSQAEPSNPCAVVRDVSQRVDKTRQDTCHHLPEAPWCHSGFFCIKFTTLRRRPASTCSHMVCLLEEEEEDEEDEEERCAGSRIEREGLFAMSPFQFKPFSPAAMTVLSLTCRHDDGDAATLRRMSRCNLKITGFLKSYITKQLHRDSGC